MVVIMDMNIAGLGTPNKFAITFKGWHENFLSNYVKKQQDVFPGIPAV
jgi:hypothetical protein